jgi:hypothetical protein
MPRPRIAIATCAEYADLELDDDLLREALRERGCEARAVVWDEEGTDWSRFDSASSARPGTTTRSTGRSWIGRGRSEPRPRCTIPPT